MDRCKKCGSIHNEVTFIDKGGRIKKEDLSKRSLESSLLENYATSEYLQTKKEALHVTCALCGYSYVRETLDASDMDLAELEELEKKPGVCADDNCLEEVFDVNK